MAKSKTAMRPGVYGTGGLIPSPWAVPGKRTNNRLIRGPKVDVPATVGLEIDPAPAVDKSFQYQFNWDHDTASSATVLMSKGNIAAFNDNGLLEFADYDAVDQKVYPVGLTYLNQMKPVADRLAGNRPAFAIRGFFELPVFATYADAAAVSHKWGAVLAYDGSLMPGDTLRLCGSGGGTTWDGALAPGWLTNANAAGTAKLTPYESGIIAQVYEFDEGPSFDGLTEWVQFDNPYEYEDNEAFWRGADAKRHGWRDPDSNTGFSFGPGGAGSDEGMYPYDPRYGDEYWRDAAGLPNLSDGANWESVISEKITFPDATAAPVTFDAYVFYYAFGNVGALLEADGTPWADDVDETYVNAALTTTLNGYDDGSGGFNSGTVLVNSASDDGKGTLTLNITYGAGGTGGDLEVYNKSKGQVAGVPVNIDIARCIGLVRLQLLVR